MHRIVRGIVTRPLRLGILIVAVLAGCALLIFQAGLPALSLSMPSLGFSGVSGSQPSATENYMRGTETFNAELVWNAYSAEAQGTYQSRGINLQALQNQMDQARQAGIKLEQVTYIGGKAFADGTSMHFYTVMTSGPQSQSEPEPMWYVFTLDRSGKIVRVQ
ncbi:MAG: hypothetical protein AB7P40_26600 [Chloroflexota bacterium]